MDQPEEVLLGKIDHEKSLAYRNRYWDEKARLFFKDYARDIKETIANKISGEDPNYPFILAGGIRMGHTANSIQCAPFWHKSRKTHASAWIASEDAEKLDVTTGELIRVTSKSSSLVVPVEIDKNARLGHIGMLNILDKKHPDKETWELKYVELSIDELVDVTTRDPYTGCPATPMTRVTFEKVESEASA